MENTLLLDINKELDGKRVLVTGGTKGIGRSIVDRLLNAGATIITTARTLPNDLPDSVSFIQANVSTPEGTEKIIKETLENLGGLDILINNVGGSSSSTAGALGLSDDD
jgi:NAD(P)-dependent dehydrogenase (short-subunit alcohol dehydrogenase family)